MRLLAFTLRLKVGRNEEKRLPAHSIIVKLWDKERMKGIYEFLAAFNSE